MPEMGGAVEWKFRFGDSGGICLDCGVTQKHSTFITGSDEAAVKKAAYADPTAKEGDWSAVDLKPVRPLRTPVSLEQLKADPLTQDLLLLRNSRLSVSPVSDAAFRRILELGLTRTRTTVRSHDPTHSGGYASLESDVFQNSPCLSPDQRLREAAVDHPMQCSPVCRLSRQEGSQTHRDPGSRPPSFLLVFLLPSLQCDPSANYADTSQISQHHS